MSISHANASDFFCTVKARKLHHLSYKNNQRCQKRLLTVNVTCGHSCKKREMLHDPEIFSKNFTQTILHKIQKRVCKV